ncbi:hypothetical protein [uncultured Amnibacterium sp.]|uniref:hypothetical protein n=1 Tax=uncultured Amnibacterium sp. TaxID=1631851 RepID=UPI0035C99A13
MSSALSRRSVKALIVYGLVGGWVLIVLGVALVPPVAVLGVAAVITSILVIEIDQARVSRRWGLLVTTATSFLLWIAAIVVAGVAWGRAFDLADADQAVPAALGITVKIALVIGVPAFVVLVVSGVRALVRARRLLRAQARTAA